MTMLAMWLDETSVALATDSKMTGTDDKVPKLHLVPPGKVMFGVGFGDGAFEWLIDCPCNEEHPYPEHWRDCSQADNMDELERIIRNDLQVGEFPLECHLELWLAGANEQGILEAFILDETGCRVSELAPGNVIFNGTIIRSVSTQPELIASVPEIQPTKPEQQFQALKKEMDDKQIEFSGAKALKEVSRQLIEFCEENNDPYIGGSLQYHVIFRSNVRSKYSLTSISLLAQGTSQD